MLLKNKNFDLMDSYPLYKELVELINNMDIGETFSRDDIIKELRQNKIKYEDLFDIVKTPFNTTLLDGCVIRLGGVGILSFENSLKFTKEKDIPMDLHFETLCGISKLRGFKEWFISLEDKIRLQNGHIFNGEKRKIIQRQKELKGMLEEG